eukprot:jgi/Chrzof1/13864/Cz08g15140.t1
MMLQVCFAASFQQLVVYEYTGPVPRGPISPPSDEPSTSAAVVGFNSFFQLKHRLYLAQGAEVLCRSFCVAYHGCKYLLVASATPATYPTWSQRGQPVSDGSACFEMAASIAASRSTWWTLKLA